MSLDFYLRMEMDVGYFSSKMHSVKLYAGNYTHNVIPMWERAGCYQALYKSDGQKAHEIIHDLKSAFDLMLNDPDGYQSLNPMNKFGSYNTALEFLKEVIRACEEFPGATIHISA